MSRPNLTMKMLLTAESNGFGYLGHSARRPESWASEQDPHLHAKMLDQILLEAAQELKLTPEQFTGFADSKAGRFYGDTLMGPVGRDQTATRIEATKALKGYLAYSKTADA